MPLEPPLIATAQDRLNQVRQQIDLALEALVADMVALAAADRDAAVNDAQARATADVEKARVASEADAAERLAAAQSQAAKAEERAQALAAERAEVERRLAESSADTRVEERQCDLACLERLVDGVRDLDSATTLSQILDKLADHAASQIARAVVLIIRHGEMNGWRMHGFGPAAPDPASLRVSLDTANVIRDAVQTRTRATTGDRDDVQPQHPLPFVTLPAGRIGLALPLTVGVRTVAVLYADEGESGEITVPSAWPEVLEILARHAAARLELLTIARAYGLHTHEQDAGTPAADARPARPTADEVGQAGVPAVDLPATTRSVADGAEAAAQRPAPPGGRPPSLATDKPVDAQARQVSEEDGSALRYARLLISEIKLYHEDAVNQGRRDANLLARLGPEIARARRLYEERIPADVRNRADHFGQELVRTLANGDPRLLGQAT